MAIICFFLPYSAIDCPIVQSIALKDEAVFKVKD